MLINKVLTIVNYLYITYYEYYENSCDTYT